MKRLVALVGATLLVLGLAAPAVLAAQPDLPHTGRVLMAFGGDLTVPAGELADAVIVVQGDTIVSGQVNTLVVIDGTATLRDAQVESIVVLGGSLLLEGKTVVLGDIRSLESSVGRADSAVVQGSIKGIDAELFMLGAILVPALLLFAIGLALATILAGVILAGLAARQVRSAERLIVHEPGWVLVVGLLAAIGTPILAVIAIVTIVGAPLGIGVLIAVLPAAAFIGYLVAAIFLGERILDGTRPATTERPYRAAILGVVILQAVGILPGIGALVTGVASLFGLGAIFLLAWRTLRGHGSGEVLATHGAPMPIGA
jgi:hypothetical protein